MIAFIKGLGALLLLLVLAAAAGSVLAGAIWLLRKGLLWFFDGVTPTVTAAIVAAVATTVVSVLTVVVGRYLEHRAAVKSEIRKSKIPVYADLVQSFLTVLNQAGEEGVDPDEQVDMVEVMQRLTPQILTWAGDDVLVKWSRYRRAATNLDPIQSMFELEKVFKAIRKDFGHSNRKVGKGDILGLFVNDIHDYVEGEDDGKDQGSGAR